MHCKDTKYHFNLKLFIQVFVKLVMLPYYYAYNAYVFINFYV